MNEEPTKACTQRNSSLVHAYQSLVASGTLSENLALRALLVRKECRSWSGVCVRRV
jgi:hypothetical protein